MIEVNAEQRYREHVAEVERHWATVLRRKAIHEATVTAQYRRRLPTIKGTKPEQVIDGLCAGDTQIRDAKSGIDRNQRLALMYGIGALLDRLPPLDSYQPGRVGHRVLTWDSDETVRDIP